MQIRIALCDDDAAYRGRIKQLLQEYKQADQTLSVLLSYFSSGTELLDYIDKNGNFDLYILDIFLPDINGIQLGANLREQGDPGMIIYLTLSPDFAVESYYTDALYYLLKPVDTSQFFRCMDRAISRLDSLQKDHISIRTACSTRIVCIRNILYAERVERRIHYYLYKGSTVTSATFSGTFQNAVAPLLAHSSFLAVGSSFAVNLFHVTEVAKSDLLLTDGHRVPIPRRTYKTVKSKWADYWARNGDTHII